MAQDWIQYKIQKMEDWAENNHAAMITAVEVIENNTPHTTMFTVPTERTVGLGIDDIIQIKFNKV